MQSNVLTQKGYVSAGAITGQRFNQAPIHHAQSTGTDQSNFAGGCAAVATPGIFQSVGANGAGMQHVFTQHNDLSGINAGLCVRIFREGVARLFST